MVIIYFFKFEIFVIMFLCKIITFYIIIFNNNLFSKFILKIKFYNIKINKKIS